MSAPPRLLIFAFLVSFLPHHSRGDYVPVRSNVPEPKREFRAAWIATVHNIDWPSTYTLSPSQQRSELIGLLDLAAETGLNAVILQVRTECDAFYKSSIEPWSWFLTGKMGSPPPDGYDPLQFATVEARKRGIEVHAWFNPFRASATERSPKTSRHISRTHPSLMLSVGSQKWADPSSDFVRKRAISVMVDVANRYDVDGVHIDDYFYPYPKTVNGKVYDQFNDSAAYRAYQAKGGKLDIRYWRRSNIDNFIQSMYSTVKSTKPSVQVGISPFGIWRPGYPSTVKAGLDAYDHIFADSRKWLKSGWLDYFSPQLYWRIYPADQSFTALQSWWTQENTAKRHLWPGIASSRILSSEDKGRPSTETIKQIDVTRNKPSPLGPGHIHWSIKAIKEDRGGLRARLRSSYAESAIPPASPWLSSSAPDPVYVAPIRENGGLTLAFQPGANARWKLVQVKEGRNWVTLRRFPAAQSRFRLDKEPEEVAIRHISATGVLSIPTVLRRQ
ncbi:MAG: family 10 glycosylhydrolase [Verrucomicrobiota bacterium]